MPTYNRSRAIGETMRTLLEGTFTDFDLLVRDDGDGCDGTEEAVAAAAQGDARVIYHRNIHKLGMPGNLNAGIRASTGDFIAVCHDHDVYKPSFLEKMVAVLQRQQTALFVHCAIQSITQDGKFVAEYVGDWPELTSGSAWLRHMLSSLSSPVCALTVVRREAHEKHGLYDLSCGFIADVEMWMRLSRFGDVAYVREPLIGVREREKGHSETVNGERWMLTAAKINRQYIPAAYGNGNHLLHRLKLELEYSRKFLKSRTSRLVHRLVKSASTS